MATATTITGARTMWELVERRAGHPRDHPMLIDADGHGRSPSASSAGGPSGGRRALRRRGRARAASCPGSSPAASTRWCCRWPSAGWAPSRTPSSTSTASGRWGSPSARPGPAVRRPRRVAGHRLRRPGRAGPRGRRPSRPELLVVDDGLPEGEPVDARHRPPRAARPTTPRSAGSTTRRAARPTPRGSATPTRPSSPAAGAWPSALDMSPDDVGSIAFPFAHIAGPDYLVTMLSLGFPAVMVEAFSAPDVLPLFRRHGVTMVGGSTAFYVAYLGRAAQAARRADPARPCA